jgi:hypothetical protein
VLAPVLPAFMPLQTLPAQQTLPEVPQAVQVLPTRLQT